MKLGERIKSAINFNEFVDFGREFVVVGMTTNWVSIQRLDGKFGTATFLKEFIYNNFGEVWYEF